MTLEQLAVFVKIAQAGSFTRAAAHLGIEKSYASRVVAGLERELGAKLIERTTRTFALTEIGKKLVDKAVGILDAVDETAKMVQDSKSKPSGVLRITCGVEFGVVAVGDWIAQFISKYPEVNVEVEYTSRIVDIIYEGFDLAIRIGELADSQLVARLLGAVDYGLFASPGYLRDMPPPTHPETLLDHHLVAFAASNTHRTWHLRSSLAGGARVKLDPVAKLVANNSFAVRTALLGGIGIGPLPLFFAAPEVKAGRLVPVLPDWRPDSSPIHAVYPGGRYVTPKVKAFIELAIANFPQI